MSGHNDHYIEQYCERNEKICINCGSIFVGYVRRGMGPSTAAIESRIKRARDNEECYPPQPPQPPQPPPKLKPGVQPWRPQ